MFDKINRFLLENGFQRKPKCKDYKYIYQGSIEAHNLERDKKELSLTIAIQDLPLFSPPLIWLNERPAPLDRLCVHFESPKIHSGNEVYPLCLLDKDLKQIDPYHPTEVISSFLTMAKNLINTVVADSPISDFKNEFVAYFRPNIHGFSLTIKEPVGETFGFELESANDSAPKFLISDSNNTRHINKRLTSLNIEGLQILRSLPTAFLSIDSVEFLPETMYFDHNSLNHYLDWLKLQNSNHYQLLKKQLVNSMFTAKLKNSGGCFLLILEIDGEKHGIYCQLEKNFKGRFCNSAAKVYKSLHSKAVTKVYRIRFEELSELIGVERNFLENNLIDKRIALIGCGTLGSFVAISLLKAGAGCNGKLSLFDDQVLSPNNVSRHLLGSQYINKNKAEALATFLNEQSIVRDISGCPVKAPSIDSLMDYDIVIDATGDYSFSVRSNYEYLRLKCETKSDFYHVSLYSGGESARVLKVGNTGCFRCLDSQSFTRVFPEFKHANDTAVVNKKCGETYLPFPVSASMSAAGFLLRVLLENLKEPTLASKVYFEAYSKRVKQHKNQVLKKQPNCPQCLLITE